MTKYVPETAALDDVVMTGAELMESTSLVVKAMSTDYGTKVTFAGEGAYTDGDDVNLPVVPMDAEVTKRTALVLAGYGSHEGLHKILTGFDRLRPLMRRAHDEGKWLTKSMANGLEDVRIEHGGTQLYGGIAQAIDKTAREVNRQFLDDVYVKMPEVVDDFGKIGPVAVTWEGRRRLGYPDPSNEECLSKLPKKIRRKVEKIVDQVMKIPHGVTGVGQVDKFVAHQGSVDVWKLAKKIADGYMRTVVKIKREEWEKENPPMPPQPPEGEQSPDAPEIEIQVEGECESESEQEGDGKGKGKPQDKDSTDEDKPDDGDGDDEGADNEGDAGDEPDGEDGAGDSDSDTDGEGDEGGDEGDEGSPDDGTDGPVEPGDDAGDGEDETNQGDSDDEAEEEAEGDEGNPGETGDDEGIDEDTDEDGDGEGESGGDGDAGELDKQEAGDEGVSDGDEQDTEKDADGAKDAEDGDGEDGDTGNENDDGDDDEEQEGDGDDDGVDEGIDDEGEGDGDDEQDGDGEDDGDGASDEHEQDRTRDDDDTPADDDEDEDRGGGDIGAGINTFDPTTVTEPEPIEPGLHEAMKREIDELKKQNGGTGYVVMNPSGDKFVKRRDISDMENTKRKGKEWYVASKSEVSATVGTVRRKLERVVTAMSRTHWENAKRNGRLDVRRNVSKIVNLKSNVFRNKVEEININTAITILIDMSYSMRSYGKDAMAQQITIAVAEALAPVGVPLEVLGHHTTCNWDQTKVTWDEEIYGRVDNIVMWQFKDFEDGMSACRGSMGTIARRTDGANADGDAIMWAAQRLYERPEEKKVLFVLSDGQPAYYSQTRDVDQYTRDAVEWCMFRGIEVMGLGILDDSVKQYYPKYVTVHDLDEFGKVYIDEIVKLMLGRAKPDQSILIDRTTRRNKTI